MDGKQQVKIEELGRQLIEFIEKDVYELEGYQKFGEVTKELNNQLLAKRYLDFSILYSWVINLACGKHYNISETTAICEAVFDKVRVFLDTRGAAGLFVKDYIKDQEELDFLSRQFTKNKITEVTLSILWDSVLEKRFFDYSSVYSGSFKFFPVAAKFYKHIFGNEPKNDFNSSILTSHFAGLLSKVFAIRMDDSSQEEVLKLNKIIETNPGYAKAYYNRAVVYFARQEYDKSWLDIHKAQKLGCEVDAEFLEALKKASNREE